MNRDEIKDKLDEYKMMKTDMQKRTILYHHYIKEEWKMIMTSKDTIYFEVHPNYVNLRINKRIFPSFGHLNTEEEITDMIVLLQKLMAGVGINEQYFNGESFIGPQYDSDVVVLLDDSALWLEGNATPKKLHEFYEKWQNGEIDGQVWEAIWHSDGCRQIYEFCKAPHNNIRVQDRKAFTQEGREVDV